MSAKSVRHQIIIVDDHPLVRCGLANLISDEIDLEIVGEASSADEAMQLIKQIDVDLLVVDLEMGGKSGLDLIKRIHLHNEKLKILVCSMHDETLFAERCVRAGAAGYVNKEVATERVVEAIRQVVAGEVYLSPEITRTIVRGLARGKKPGQSPVASLTDRELEVFSLIGRGNTTREIAQILNLSIKTIETYRDHIKTKLNVKTTAELSRHAVQWVLENG